MIYTNKQNLPEALCNALKWDDYDPGHGDYSPSSLGKPPYMAHLERTHGDVLTKDVSDNVWLLLGKAVHKIVEIGSEGIDNNFSEERIYVEFESWIISMQFDNLFLDQSNGILDDYKATSIYKFKPDYNGTIPSAPDWDAQVNIGAYILRKKWLTYDEKSKTLVPGEGSIELNKLRILGICKDHKQTTARTSKEYPNHPICTREFSIWSDEKVEEYIREKAVAHDISKEQKIEDVEPCTKEDMWATDDKIALMKHGRKKAVKLFPSRKSLEKYIANYEIEMGPKKHYEEFRPGERKRCVGYCDVGKNGLCPSYNKFLEEQK